MARKPVTRTSKTIDSLSSLVKDYFELQDGLVSGLLSHTYHDKRRSVERQIRSQIGLPPASYKDRGY